MLFRETATLRDLTLKYLLIGTVQLYLRPKVSENNHWIDILGQERNGISKLVQLSILLDKW